MNYEKRYDDEDNVAVLISPGHGAGWSTWSHNPGQTEAMLFDSRLVDYILTKGADDGFENFAQGLGYEGYFGGIDGLTVVWLEPGTRFIIDEYDGNESIKTFDDLVYTA